MTTVISSDLSGSGILIDSKVDATDYLIEAGVSVSSSGSKAISLQGGHHDLTVNGTVQATNYGTVLGDTSFTADYDNHLEVGEDGSIAGGVLAVASWGSSTILNRGTLTGGDIGLRLNMSGPTESTVTNYGTISGGDWGIDSSASGVGQVHITNHGTVEGGVYSFIDRGGAGDTIINHGFLDGEVNFGAGSDHLDNRGGQINGQVQFGTGLDVVLPGGGGETFYGGDGLDTLDFRTGGGLRVSLVTGTGTGRAQGDQYVGFERVLGSATGADTLIGDGWDNVFEGFGGDDVLRGGGSEDTLLGGRGADALYGGTEMDVLQGGGGADKLAGGSYKDELRGGNGNDAFLFASTQDGGDTIADFHSAAGDNDRFLMDADGFGAGLQQGRLDARQFRSRADNDAQDNNDRFIFRSTDRTLWFDSDGSGGNKAVLLADLRAGAVVTASDIVLI